MSIDREYSWATDVVHTGDELIPLITGAVVKAWPSEDALQQFLLELLMGAGVPAEREYSLADGRSRVDLFVPTRAVAGDTQYPPKGIAVEVKVKGSRGDVFRQLTRYSQCSDVLEVVLVTTSAAHLGLPSTIELVPLTVIPILEGGL